MRSDAEFARVQSMLARGLSDYEVARRCGVPRPTVQRWRLNPGRQKLDPTWRPQRADEYAYALGLYLGDGHVVRRGRTGVLVISLDPRYERVIEQARQCLIAVFNPAVVHRYERPVARTTILQVCSLRVPVAFPQHGPGKKHQRPIHLVPWQLAVTRAHPQALIRGLIHSDGCRSVNRFSTRLPSGRIATYGYPRYFFTNLSADIRQIFCDHCELLGIHWTQSNPRNISVSHRYSVALLDSFVGPKT